jgi:LuxR family maltose regulon positive regulatory protein
VGADCEVLISRLTSASLSRRTPEPTVDDAAARTTQWRGAGFELFDSKLQPPFVRPAIVPRSALLERLDGVPPIPVCCVAAPAGYGKTTLLAQWADRNPDRVAWLSLDERDNDPEILLVYIAAALNRVQPVDPGVFRRRSPGSFSHGATVVLRIAAAMSSMRRPVALVLDHVEALWNQECLDAIAELSMHLPIGAQLVVTTRAAPPVPLSRHRSAGTIVEIGASDLALSDREARALLDGAGVRVGSAATETLIARAEGWPVALYLGALALNAGAADGSAGLDFSGDDRLVADYLQSEFLARLSDDDVSFLTRTSVLDRMSAPLCDAVLDATDSDTVLRRLEDSNLLLVPLDRRRRWYRYHHLFREMLRAELERRAPSTIAELHRRAASWCEAHGMPEIALAHAQEAGDAGRATELILDLAQPTWASGRVDTVLGWMEWLERRQLIEQNPAVAVHGALTYALLGRARDALRWADAAERVEPTGYLHDGSTMDSYIAYLRALLARDGVEAMRRDARRAWGGLAPSSPYRPTMAYTDALCDYLEGDSEGATLKLTDAVDASVEVHAVPFAAMILATLCAIAIGAEDWPTAQSLADRAIDIVERSSLDEYWTSALVYATTARVALFRGDIKVGRDAAAHTTRLRPLLTSALPVASVLALIELAHAYIALTDTAGARASLRQARDILHHRPDLGVLASRADELDQKLRTIGASPLGASALTPAELRLVPLLHTHLKFPEIGQRLNVSRHTVKTQAVSIYQKLGVSSRAEAIDRMHELGLLDA